MKIEKEKKHNIGGDDFLVIPSTVNKKKLGKLYGMLSAIYRNPIGSIVREYVSNGLDANNEAYAFKSLSAEELTVKYPWILDPVFDMNFDEIAITKASLTKAEANDPVVISIKNDELNVRDYGLGMSPERMTHIFFNYLDSTKEDTDDEIGGFGIGAKSALAYTDTFYIDTIYKGIKYNYIMTKDEFDIPQGQLLFSTPTDDHNGTLIRIPIEYGDKHNFVDEVRKQLTYVDNLYINDPDWENWDHDENDFTILRGENWLYRPDCDQHYSMHICLDRITYQIDWSELNLPSIDFPVALKFNTGELKPTPSRESIVYTNKAKELIKSRIETVKKSFNDLYNEQLTPTDDVSKYLSERHNTISDITINGFDIDVTEIVDNGLMGVKFKPFEDLGYRPLSRWEPFEDLFTIRGKISGSNGKVVIYNNSNLRKVNKHILDNSKFLETKKGDNIEHKNACFILEEHYNCTDVSLIRRKKVGLHKFSRILNLTLITRDRWMPIIRAYCKYFYKYAEDKIQGQYSDYLMHPNWEKTYAVGKSRYSKTKAVYTDNVIPCSEFSSYSTSFHRGDFKFNHIPKILVYSPYSDRVKAENFGKLLKSSSAHGVLIENKSLFKLITVSKENLKHMVNIENAVSVDDVLEGKVPLFRNIVTAHYLKSRYENIKIMSELPDNINSDLKEKAIKLNQFFMEYTSDSGVYSRHNPNTEFIKECINIALIHNLFNMNVVEQVAELESYLHDIDMIRYIRMYEIPREILLKYLKDSGKKVDNYNYLTEEGKKQLNELQSN